MSRSVADLLRVAVLEATLERLRESLVRDMPPGPQRDYWLWGLDPASRHHAAFVRTIAAVQLSNLTVTLLGGLVEDGEWPVLTDLAATMNVYQIYEVVTDNLAIGGYAPGRTQAEVLHAFNATMVSTLEGPQWDRPAEVLAPLRSAAATISGFAQSLAGPAHRQMAAAFTAGSAGRSVRELEYDVWPVLVANALAGRAVVDRLTDRVTQPIVRAGLVGRYRAVDRTLSGEHLPLFELATIGAHTILVAPTLAYYVGALAEILYPEPALPACVSDGTLPEVLYDAALLVRLLNDLGPRLLSGGPGRRRGLLSRVRRAEAAAPDGARDAITLLLRTTAESTVFTRLHKDLRHGEFNVALYGVRRAASVPAALAALGAALDHLAGLYALHSSRLAAGLSALRVRLTNPRPLTLVDRFVRFHEQLYARPYTDPTGEYAI